MSNKLTCPDDGMALVTLYVNANQANKYGIDWNTNVLMCVHCKALYKPEKLTTKGRVYLDLR